MTFRNRIDDVFDRCREEGRAALIPYVTCGFPNGETTEKVLPILAENGADIIELGVPFSDPIADGPTIQRSSTIALQQGMDFLKTLKILKDFRRSYDTPVVLFGALNPYLIRGLENSARMAKEHGAEAILAADLPVEEANEFLPYLKDQQLHLILLIAPTSPDERKRRIADTGSGFLYAISMKGTTGARETVATDTEAYMKALRSVTDKPIALGFGISKPEHVRRAVSFGTDAVVVGSALINTIDEAYEQKADMKERVGGFIRSLAAELKKG